MSIESAKAFIERMKTDEDFRNRVAGAETAEGRKTIVEAEGGIEAHHPCTDQFKAAAIDEQ